MRLCRGVSSVTPRGSVVQVLGKELGTAGDWLWVPEGRGQVTGADVEPCGPRAWEVTPVM